MVAFINLISDLGQRRFGLALLAVAALILVLWTA